MAVLESRTQRIPMALTAHAIPHLMGYLRTKSGAACANPLGALGLMDTAVELGLSGVDCGIPYDSPDELAKFRDALAERSLSLVAEFDIVTRHEAADVRRCIDGAATLGARVVRVMISGILCGDRRGLSAGWDDILRETAARLRELLPYAEGRGVCLAVENHQDATSSDLIRLFEMSGSSAAYGVTLDAGNPLAVAEDPITFAQRIAPLLRHVHMKDYTIHFAPNGYRLARCAAGDGVVDFPAILQLARDSGHDILPGLEIGAQATRTIPFLEDGWWDCHADRSAAELLPALRVLWKHGRPESESYASAWESGAESPAVCDEEWDLLRRSAAYFRTIVPRSLA